MAESTIAEFLVALGFKVDEAGQRKFSDAMVGMTKLTESLSAGLIGIAAGVGAAIASTANDAFRLNVILKSIGTTAGGESAQGITALSQALEKVRGISQQQTQGFVQQAAINLQHNPQLAPWLDQEVGGQGTISDKLTRLATKFAGMNDYTRAAYMKGPLGQLLPDQFRQALADPSVAPAVKDFQARMGELGVDMGKLTAAAQEQHEKMMLLKADWDDLQKAMAQAVLPTVAAENAKFDEWIRKNFPMIHDWMNNTQKRLENAPEPVKAGVTAAVDAGQLLAMLPPGVQTAVTGVAAWFGAKGLGALFGGLFGGGAAAGAPAAAGAVGGALPAMAAPFSSTGGGGGLGLGAAFEWIHQNFANRPGFQSAQRSNEQTAKEIEDWFSKLSPSGLAGDATGWLGKLHDTFFGASDGKPGAQSAPAPSGAKATDEPAGGNGWLQRMWHGFWDSIVGTAHAEELPGNIKLLSQHVADLNDTFNQMLLDGMFSGANTRGPPPGGSSEHGGGGGGPSTAPLADRNLDPAQQGLLHAIYGPESGGDYTIRQGGGHFSDMSQHPEGVGPGGVSTAAGAGQFITSTWKMIQSLRPDIKDMRPENQDQATWFLAERVYRLGTGRDLKADLTEGGHEEGIAGALKTTWTSITAANIKMAEQSGGFMRTPAYHHHESEDKNVEVNQHVTNHITGASDANDTARKLKDVQDKHQSDLVHMFNASVQ